METIKKTVSSVLGTGTDTNEGAASHQGSAAHTSTDTTDTVRHDTPDAVGDTGATGATGLGASSFHDQTTRGVDNDSSRGGLGVSSTGAGDSGLASDTSGHGSSPTGARDTGLGRDTTSSGPAGAVDQTETGHSTHGRSDNDLTQSESHHDPREVQSPAQGPDPALVGDAKEHPKMTGQGAPGSHSAVFGLTPDGKRHDDSSHGATPVRPAHSDETTMGRKSVVGSGTESGAGRDAVGGGGGGVSDQIDAPDLGKKGLERTDPAPPAAAGSSGKPGAGLTGLRQS